MATEPSLTNIRSFWGTEACDTHEVEHPVDDIDFLARFRRNDIELKGICH